MNHNSNNGLRWRHIHQISQHKLSHLSLGLLFIISLLTGCTTSVSPTAMQLEASPALVSTSLPSDVDPYQQERYRMVETTIEARGVDNPDVLQAMRSVPRHRFVPDDYLDLAYGDHPLPIGYGQTISQPYIVAWMTELLELKPGAKVLEIGTGSGYQAAVLAALGCCEVYSIEIISELAASALIRLKELGVDVKVRQGDGYYGWPDAAPFDAIIVTAAPDHLPAPLVEQLKEDGRLVIPIGPVGGYQALWKFVKQDGDVRAYNMGGVSFVPFTGQGVAHPQTATPER